MPGARPRVSPSRSAWAIVVYPLAPQSPPITARSICEHDLGAILAVAVTRTVGACRAPHA